MNKVKTLLSTDGTIKDEFKSETAKNGKDMSEVTESLWASYIKASRANRAKRYAKIKEERDARERGE